MMLSTGLKTSEIRRNRSACWFITRRFTVTGWRIHVTLLSTRTRHSRCRIISLTTMKVALLRLLRKWVSWRTWIWFTTWRCFVRMRNHAWDHFMKDSSDAWTKDSVPHGTSSMLRLSMISTNRIWQEKNWPTGSSSVICATTWKPWSLLMIT